jgi:hypothetical protein
LFSKKTEADRRFSRFLGVAFFHPIFQSIQSFTGCCDSSSPGAIIAWVSRIYVGVTPSQQGVLQITSLRGSHLRGGYFELLRSQEFRRASPPPLLYWPLPTKARIFIVFRFIIIEYSSLRDFGP